MSNHCHGSETCSVSKTGASSSHQHHVYCSCCRCCECQCCEGCCCHHNEEQECLDKTHRLLLLADEAWMEVLKEKIKEHIRASDHKIDEMARIVAEANREYWHHKMAKAKIQEEYEKRLSELFDEGYQQSKKSKSK